ncbi:MAG: nuclear transport factor 2 family protein [Salinigranum sp.]
MSTTEDVLSRHLQAFGDQDMEGIMADYADDAVVVTEQATFRGPDEIRGLFDELFEEFSKPGMTMGVDTEIVEDDMAYITWHAETADNDYEFATDTFLIEDGEITKQTFAGKITPKA